MNGLLIGVYGLYLILVGLNGNAGALAGKVQTDSPKFLPWIIAIFVLAFLRGSSDTGRKVVEPFIFLLVLNYVLRNFDTIKGQFNSLETMASQAGTSTPAKPAPDSMTTGAPSPNSASYSNTAGDLSNASDALFAMENYFG